MRRIIMTVCLFLGIAAVSCAQKKVDIKHLKKVNTQIAAHKRDSLILDSVVTKAKAGDAAAQNTLGTYYYTGKYVKKDAGTAAKWWAVSAKNNNMDAIANLGLCYQKGNGTKKDSVMALNLYRKSIEAGNIDLLNTRIKNAGKDGPFDCVFVGQCLQNGIGTKKNIEKAAEYYEMAIKMKSTDGIREAALLYYAQKNYAKSSSLLKQAVNGGETECIYPYAESLKMGYGMDVNKQQAAIYMLKAAQEGNHIAQNELATMYMKGEGAAKSESSGLNWYKEASVEVPWAQWNAGVCYVDGIGAKVSYDEALLWIADAVQNVKAFGKMFKDKLSTKEDKGWGGLPFVDYVNGVKAYSEKKFDDAETSFKLVEKKKMIDATTMLGVCYNSKDWKKYNVKKAVKYFTTAMKAGDSKAKFLMSKLYEEGNGVEKDAAKALKLLMDASDAGYAPAQSCLGDMYFEGRGVERSDLAAVQCYQKAMKNGYISSSSLKRLAEYYSKGNGGLRKDENMAKKLVAKATKTDAMENLIKEAF